MAKSKFKIANIQWLFKKVKIDLIDPTPGNYKIKTELGKKRLQASLGKFGLAGSVLVNPTGKRYVLIDGNSRLEEAKENGDKDINICYPSKSLSPKDFKEMAAMFDYATAGEVDIERIKKELGTSDDFFARYGMEVPLEKLAEMGNNAKVEAIQYPEKKGKEDTGGVVSDIKMINLFLSDKMEADIRKWEPILHKKFKTVDVSTMVYKALKSLVK